MCSKKYDEFLEAEAKHGALVGHGGHSHSHGPHTHEHCPGCSGCNIALLDDKLMECHDCGITFPHEHHHHGDAGHGHPSPAELAVIEETIQKIGRYLQLGCESGEPSWHINEALKQVFTKNIHKIYSPVDLYDHNEKFKKALNSVGVYLKWGRKAKHLFKHAYVLNFSNEEGGVYTIQTDHDLDKVDNSSFSWASVDLFGEDE